MFSIIFINKKYLDDAEPVLQKFPNAKKIPISGEDEIFEHIHTNQQAKKSLYLTKLAGNFVKSCPGTSKDYRCCQYYVINEMTNCPLDCSYCILQNYLDIPVITYYLNIKDMLQELKKLSNTFPKRIIRIGTGELTDSLALDHIFHTNSKIIDQIIPLQNIVFEVKTKTNRVHHLLPLAHPRLVFSWSVNPENIIIQEEHQTSDLSHRLSAMESVLQTSAKIGLHFDPIIWYEKWEAGYRALIERLGSIIPSTKIAWISMGSFRHPKELRFEIMKNHPNSHLTWQTQITGMDGKRRYPKFERVRLYKYIYELLRTTWGHQPFIYFCMESPDIWEEVMGWSPDNNPHLDYLFAKSLQANFPDMEFSIPNPESYPEDW